MKIDDIFEAMTDIDDRFIEAARPIEQLDDGQPMIVMPAPRKARWKTIVPAAACLAAVATAGAFGVKYLRERDGLISQASSSLAPLKEYWYPDEAEFVVSDDIEYLGNGYQSVSSSSDLSMYDASADYAKNYKELAKKSDLIVSGTFIDVIHQTSDSEQIVNVGGDHFWMSYNWFEVSDVIKGDINAGSVLTIGQNSTINSANGKDDKYNVYTCDQLSPMLKGDKWIYFLKQEENGTFSPVNGPQGRYPMPNHTNRFVSWDGETSKLDKYSTYKNIAPARDEIYAELLKQLGLEDAAEIPKIEQIGVMDNAKTFAMPEFPDYDFKASRAMVWADYLGITMDIMDISVFKAPDGGRLENLMLADLTGDGKRELCATISENYIRSVVVRDFENGVTYTLPGGKAQEYALAAGQDVLYVVTSIWESVDCVLSTSVPLTLDMMLTDDSNKQLTEIALDNERWFTLPDFEGFEFNVDNEGLENTQFRFGWGSKGTANLVNDAYLCDLDGDGRREIILNCLFVGDGCIRVYGFMDNGELGEALYFENGGCQLVKSDGALNYSANGETKPFKFSRSDLKPMFSQNYTCEILDWGHTLDFSDVLSPELAAYNITISDRTLKIDYNGELTFHSGHKLGELYTMPDKENNSLVFVFTNASDGTVGALKISEQPAKLYHFEETIALKPAEDTLFIVHADGTEEPFKFPEGSADDLRDYIG